MTNEELRLLAIKVDVMALQARIALADQRPVTKPRKTKKSR